MAGTSVPAVPEVLVTLTSASPSARDHARRERGHVRTDEDRSHDAAERQRDAQDAGDPFDAAVLPAKDQPHGHRHHDRRPDAGRPGRSQRDSAAGGAADARDRGSPTTSCGTRTTHTAQRPARAAACTRPALPVGGDRVAADLRHDRELEHQHDQERPHRRVPRTGHRCAGEQQLTGGPGRQPQSTAGPIQRARAAPSGGAARRRHPLTATPAARPAPPPCRARPARCLLLVVDLDRRESASTPSATNPADGRTTHHPPADRTDQRGAAPLPRLSRGR